MKRLLLLAATTGYQTRAFAGAARSLGVEPVLATDRCHVLEDPWGDSAIPVRFEEPAAAAGILARQRFDGIVAVADRPAIIAALTARAAGLPWHSPEAVAACQNKYLARQRFERAGLPVPSFFRTALDADPCVPPEFPCVLKPTGLSASRGVIRANDSAEFVAAFERIKLLLERPEILALRDEQNRYVQVESYIEGREYALEGLLTHGRLQVLAVFDKPEPLEGPFFEETIYVTPARADTTGIVHATGQAARALGLSHGPIHAEMRVNPRGVWMLEVAARPIGGLCARALRFDGGLGLEELTIRHALGEDVAGVRLAKGASGVMMIPIPKAGVYAGVRGTERARAVPGIEDVIVTAKEGQKLEPLPEGASYLGFIFARASAPEEVEEALRCAHGKLRFETAATLRVIQQPR